MDSFSAIASVYDQEFTNTLVGQLQRKQVWSLLQESLSSEKMDILELNAGTGVDANHLSQLGHDVLATDGAVGMVSIIAKKYPKIETAIVKMPDLSTQQGKKFDLVFSNFGGLNCLSPKQLGSLFESILSLLEKDGKLVMVIMGRKCLWEYLYFRMKGNKNESSRRLSQKPVMASLSEGEVATWYYSPIEIIRLAGADYRLKRQSAIGLFVPPSYLNGFFHRLPFLLRIFHRIDGWGNSIKFLANYSDHFYLELIRSN